MKIAVIIPHCNGINNALASLILEKLDINIYQYLDIRKTIPVADIYCLPWYKPDSKILKKIPAKNKILHSTDCDAMYELKREIFSIRTLDVFQEGKEALLSA